MSCDANAFIQALQPYRPGLPIEAVARDLGLAPESIIKLASNENPLGMSPRAAEAVRAALADGARYPEQHDLTQALAKQLNVDADMLVLGNGSNDVLDLVARTFLDKGAESVLSQYAFVVYELATRSTGAAPIIVPATADYGHDLPAMVKAITANTKVLWIANPNNPTGTFIPYDELLSLVRQVPSHVVIVLDEAYYEYLAPENQADSISWLRELPNLILVRTFSKIYGLAGLRIGYGVMNPAIAELLNRVRQPFNVSRPGLAAAAAALTDQTFVAQSAAANTAGRRQLLNGLERQGYGTIGTEGNFITIEVPQAATLVQALLKQGVIVRPLVPYDLPNHLRVTIGTTAENDRFLQALAAASAPHA